MIRACLVLLIAVVAHAWGAEKGSSERESVYADIASIYELNDHAVFGTKAFDRLLEAKFSRSQSLSSLFEYFITRTDQTGPRFSLKYLNGELTVTHTFLQREGLVVAKVVFRSDKAKKKLEVLESSVCLLEGVFVVSEDVIPVDSSLVWRSSIPKAQRLDK